MKTTLTLAAFALLCTVPAARLEAKEAKVAKAETAAPRDQPSGKASGKAAPKAPPRSSPGSGSGGTAGKLVPWTTSMGHKCCASCIQYNDAGNCTKAGQCEPGYDSSCNKTQTQ